MPTKKQSREKLMAEMGGRCRWCSARVNLHFDCINPAGSHHHGLGSAERLRWYRAAWLAGNLQLLCARCHEVKTKNENARKRGRFAVQQILPGEAGQFAEACRKAIEQVQASGGTAFVVKLNEDASSVPGDGGTQAMIEKHRPLHSAKNPPNPEGPLT
jgi:hypothetical protein